MKLFLEDCLFYRGNLHTHTTQSDGHKTPEESMAAYRAGIKTVIIPKENQPDLSEFDKAVLEALNFVPVERIEEVLKAALTGPSAAEPAPSPVPQEFAPPITAETRRKPAIIDC